jgi:hypothetical protein
MLFYSYIKHVFDQSCTCSRLGVRAVDVVYTLLHICTRCGVHVLSVRISPIQQSSKMGLQYLHCVINTILFLHQVVKGTEGQRTAVSKMIAAR